jgi:hypothetical protein
MKLPILLVLLATIALPAFSQKTISGKSQPLKLEMKPFYKRGQPPILYADLGFSDVNGNNILEAGESAILSINIANQGKGPAQEVVVTVTDTTHDPALVIGTVLPIPFIYPNQLAQVKIPIKAGFEIASGQKQLLITIREHFGYDMDPAYLMLNTLAFREPKLVVAGLGIADAGEGTTAIREDGKLQAGEMVKLKITLQNTGQGKSEETFFQVTTTDQNIFIENGAGDLGEIGIGEVKDIWITLSPNKRVTGEALLPVFISTASKANRGMLTGYQLPVRLEQKPSEPVIVEVKPDIDMLTRQVTRFEVSSPRITTNLANVINIRQNVPSRSKRSDAVAVVIGVEKYNNFVSAPYAENDATIMAGYMKTALGIDRVYTYKSKDVTGYFFDNVFDPANGELQKAIVKGKTDLFIFYSGHGIPSKEGDLIYLLPSDGRVENIGRQGYELGKFYSNLNALGARSVTVFMDACFSGISKASDLYRPENLVAMKGVKIKPGLAAVPENSPGFTVFTSSAFEQTSLAFDPSETGLFTYFLCAGLQGKADVNGDQIVTMGELQQYVYDNVRETSVKIRGLQEPQFLGDGSVKLVEL